jgi:23S rRNA G2445 N2-methylase RlmL
MNKRENNGKNYPSIIGSDRDAGVVIAAKENAKRAGVGDMIEIMNCSISSNPWFSNPDCAASDGSVLIATNPPFGRRISKKSDWNNNAVHPLLPLYQTLAKYPQRGAGRTVQLSLIAHDFRLARTTGVDAPTKLLFATSHGGINVGAFSIGSLSSKMPTAHSLDKNFSNKG